MIFTSCLQTSIPYEKIEILGEGTYGKVYYARNKLTGEAVALKSVNIEKEKNGVSLTSLREVRILKQCKHENITLLKEIVLDSSNERIYLVLEYCELDMLKLIQWIPRPLSDSEIKGFLLQLITGVSYLHEHSIIHRDLKPSNLLIKIGTLKICDFGLGRSFNVCYKSTVSPKVATLWYRAPEVILSTGNYDMSIDMWSIGCIYAELVKRKPIFPADSEIEVLVLICNHLGSPNLETWPNFNRIPYSESLTFKLNPYNNLQTYFPELKCHGLDLLTKLISWDPRTRYLAQKAKFHPYFVFESPTPKKSFDMPDYFPIILKKN
jgi:cyclin-dependent kinase 10